MVATFEFLSLLKLLLSVAFYCPTWNEFEGLNDFSSPKLLFELPIVTLTAFFKWLAIEFSVQYEPGPALVTPLKCRDPGSFTLNLLDAPILAEGPLPADETDSREA